MSVVTQGCQWMQSPNNLSLFSPLVQCTGIPVTSELFVTVIKATNNVEELEAVRSLVVKEMASLVSVAPTAAAAGVTTVTTACVEWLLLLSLVPLMMLRHKIFFLPLHRGQETQATGMRGQRSNSSLAASSLSVGSLTTGSTALTRDQRLTPLVSEGEGAGKGKGGKEEHETILIRIL